MLRRFSESFFIEHKYNKIKITHPNIIHTQTHAHTHLKEKNKYGQASALKMYNFTTFALFCDTHYGTMQKHKISKNCTH
jgi:hypothetical protein